MSKIDKNECNDLSKAEVKLKKAIKRSPYEVENYINLSKVLWDSLRFSEAIDLLKAAKEKLSGDDIRIIEEQIEKISGGEEIWREIIREYMHNPKIEVPEISCEHETSDEMFEEKLWDFAEGVINEEEERQFWKKIKGCRSCLVKLIKIQNALNLAKQERAWSYEKIHNIIEKRKIEHISERLIAIFNEFIKKSSLDLRSQLVEMNKKIEILFKNTFIYPPPSFAPVFGVPSITVLSPFGKVWFPIVFEWKPYKSADKYSISIKDTNWSYTGKKRRIEVTQEELELAFENEYMWELKVMRADKVISNENGFFYLPSAKEIRELHEIKDQVNKINCMEEKFIILGGILEEKEFYLEAIDNYKKAYAIDPLPGIAYRIASCYNMLEIEDLRDKWNEKIYSKTNNHMNEVNDQF